MTKDKPDYGAPKDDPESDPVSGPVSGIASDVANDITNDITNDISNEKPLTFLEILGSTFAAAVGVQSKARRTRDFTRGKPLHFILAGLIFAATFVTVIILVVRAVLSSVLT